MASTLGQIVEYLGSGWRMHWGYPPVGGVFLLKEVYMSDPAVVSRLCGEESAVIVYITAEVDGVYITYGRVKPGVVGCPVATFSRAFKRAEAREAVRTLVEYALRVERVPPFQINPDVLRFADLCEEYPYLCEESVEIVKRLEERVKRRLDEREWRDLERAIRDLIRDPQLAKLLRQVVENPERLRECYVR